MKIVESTVSHLDQPAGVPDDLASSSEGGNAALRLLYDLIAQQPFFKGLNEHQLQLLTASAMQVQFEPGHLILQEGNPANRFYLILEGKVVLESKLEERGVIPIETLGPGDDLGWSWLFPPYSLQMTARALEPTKTIFFYGTRLREQCEQDHDFGYELTKRIAEVVIKRLRVTQQRLMECVETGKFPNSTFDAP
jgi:CRP/FNR family transcriptional regulator, cyclic AMP receptor protein